MNKIAKVIACITVFCSAITAAVAQEIYVGDLRLGSHNSISNLVHLDEKKTDVLQSNLLKTSNDLQDELKLKNGKTLKISALSPHDVLLIDNAENNNKVIKIDNDVGKILQRFERSNWFLYVKNHVGSSQLTGFNTNSQQVIEITKMPIKYNMFTITNTGHLLTTDGALIYHTQLILRGDRIQVNENWEPITMTTTPCSQGISTLSISHFGNKIAIQCA